MPHMRAVQVTSANGPFELVERPIPEPGPGRVRIKVQACGVCHSDVFTKKGQWPGITFPRVPGHEVVGVIDAVGKDVPGRWQPGQRVGVAGSVVENLLQLRKRHVTAGTAQRLVCSDSLLVLLDERVPSVAVHSGPEQIFRVRCGMFPVKADPPRLRLRLSSGRCLHLPGRVTCRSLHMPRRVSCRLRLS
ncbi:MAG: alcohol dehydrogenase catalytic domain-containing protein [Rhodospirillaceae bacterium]|nr:alcohol dehydrogenase catalytic domain-containing protein [Rhodospirillaceae bacterium]